MKILLLSGFLGSGKTSALLQLAAYLVRGSQKEGTSVMIIENEIGEVGVDDKVLKARGLQVKELFAGCACCTGGADLLADIRTLRDTVAPEWIVIEATGVAYPLQIKENVEACFRIPVKILAVADAKRWKRLHAYMAQLIEGQVDSADCILLNKVDLVETAEADAIEAELRGYNPGAEIRRVVANQPVDDSVWAFLDR
ncbi:MAG: cobalamin biosynthesis protein P47K [Oscillospiraceae bacterium]|nr:cobalamin biosynthesis protein P47K [Oscillospiraceae bacterium]